MFIEISTCSLEKKWFSGLSDHSLERVQNSLLKVKLSLLKSEMGEISLL